MIIEASSIPSGETIEADLCIIGAGPAGLSLASKFLGTRFRVYVLESGGEHIGERELDLAHGESVGYPYFPLVEARSMVFGGSSYIWEEWMRARPLDPIDFQARSWAPFSGWPFGYEELKPYYEHAHEALGLGPFRYQPDDGQVGIADRESPLKTVLFRYSNTADFTRMRKEIEASANVCVVLEATALEAVAGESVAEVSHVIASTDNPQRFTMAARVFVLAAGGLENPRLLLLSRSGREAGLGNDHDIVGRYFMEHPTVRRGVLVPGDGFPSWRTEIYTQQADGDSAMRGALAPSTALMERESILNGMILLAPSTELETSEAYRSLAIVKAAFRRDDSGPESIAGHALSLASRPTELLRVATALYRRRAGRTVYQLAMTVEQAPDPESRVTLGRGLDRFGRPVASLSWRLGEQERHTMRVLQESLDAALRRQGLGRVEGLLGDEHPPRTLRGEWHQMGTTRMATDPRQGVVDADCRVHGLSNLYVAGASVFPTVGYANPTLTIVALSYRLAAHLKRELESLPSLGPIW
jgi:choline dehydrogenase-like flavoprotein